MTGFGVDTRGLNYCNFDIMFIKNNVIFFRVSNLKETCRVTCAGGSQVVRFFFMSGRRLRAPAFGRSGTATQAAGKYFQGLNTPTHQGLIPGIEQILKFLLFFRRNREWNGDKVE